MTTDKGCAKDENLSPDQIWSIGWMDGSIERTLFCRMANKKNKQKNNRINTHLLHHVLYFIILFNCPISLPSVFGLVSFVLIVLSPEKNKEMKKVTKDGWADIRNAELL